MEESDERCEDERPVDPLFRYLVDTFCPDLSTSVDHSEQDAYTE